jgi:hypothetical protein
MSVSGPQAVAALDEALRDIRREENDILRKLARGRERMAKFREAESELVRQVVAAGTPLAADLEGSVVAAVAAAREAGRRRAGEFAVLGERLRAMEKTFAEHTAARAAALAELDQRQAALRALSARIASTIARQPDYERQRQVVLRLKAVAAAARAKARQAGLDRELKERPFRADPLFSYLLRRGYGTPDYRAGRLVAALDARLARFIGYAAARAHFDVLDALPERLAEHAAAQAERAAAAEDALDELERAGIDAVGGGDIREALAATQARAAALDEALTGLQDERDRLVAAATRLTEGPDDGLEEAVQRLVRSLGSTDIGALVAARRAASGGDEPLIAQLDDTRLRVLEEEVDSRDQHARLATLAARRRGLEDLEFELKAHRFDDPRSLFRDDALPTGLLDAFLTGALGAEAYWERWRAAQAWAAGTSDWGGGVGLPRHGRETPGGPAPAAPAFSRPRAAAGA